jgi:hypothetical protein
MGLLIVSKYLKRLPLMLTALSGISEGSKNTRMVSNDLDPAQR